jgi:hypothetical protein
MNENPMPTWRGNFDAKPTRFIRGTSKAYVDMVALKMKEFGWKQEGTTYLSFAFEEWVAKMVAENVPPDHPSLRSAE